MSADILPEQEHVTQELVLNILKKNEKSENVKILEFSTGPATERGENWNSTLVRSDMITLNTKHCLIS